MSYTKEEKEVHRKISMYRAKVDFYKEKIKSCYDELIKIEERTVIRNKKKALDIIEMIRIRYSLKKNYHSIMSRQHIIVDPIYKVMKLVDNNTNLSMAILEFIFKRDRSTINHALRTVDDSMDTYRKYKLEYEEILTEHNLKYKRYKPRKTGRKAKIKLEVIEIN